MDDDMELRVGQIVRIQNEYDDGWVSEVVTAEKTIMARLAYSVRQIVIAFQYNVLLNCRAIKLSCIVIIQDNCEGTQLIVICKPLPSGVG